MRNEELKQKVKDVLKENPELWRNGFGLPRPTTGTYQERLEVRERSRQSIVDGDEVEAAIDWIRKRCKTRKTINKLISSYGWKHQMEWDSGKYVSNGSFIAAALLAGYRMKRHNGPSSYFNIDTKAGI